MSRTLVKPGKVEGDDTEKQLRQSLGEEIERPKNGLDWGNANKAAELPIPAGFARITERLVRLDGDPEAEYERLEAALRVGEDRAERGAVLKALDEAETNARAAHRLWQVARLEVEAWELKNAPIFGAMRGEATRALQREKESGSRNKTITEADVEAMCAVLHPDEWSAQQARRSRAAAMVKSLEHLCEVWNRRIQTLQTMFGKQR